MNGDQEITRVSYSFAKLQPDYNQDRILSNYVPFRVCWGW